MHSLLYVSGVYVPPGTGIGQGGAGPGTGFFPGNRASADCLDSLKRIIHNTATNKVCWCLAGVEQLNYTS